MGELLVEIMRPEPDMPFEIPGEFVGPFPSGAPAIFADTVARMGHRAGIIGGVADDDFGKSILQRLVSDGVDCSKVLLIKGSSTAAAFVMNFGDSFRKFIFHIAGTPAVMHSGLSEEEISHSDFFHIMGCSLMADRAFGKKDP